MKILIRTDVHWCKQSSIIRETEGYKYSKRLDYLIKSVNWSEELAKREKCDSIIDLGDFFDKSSLDETEISALQEIKWANIDHTFLIGNHEISSRNKEASSTHIFKLLGFKVIDNPCSEYINNTQLCFLPYMFEYKKLNDIFGENIKEKRIVLSHNNIKGIKLGGFVFPSGFEVDDIKNNCNLFINGHIHSKEWIDNLLIAGNLCGQNFSENNNAHYAYVLNTDTLELKEFENPYALTFTKIDLSKNKKWPKLGVNPVLSIKCDNNNIENVEAKLKTIKDLAAKKYILFTENKRKSDKNNKKEDLIEIDHIKALQEYVKSNIGTDNIVKKELQEICL